MFSDSSFFKTCHILFICCFCLLWDRSSAFEVIDIQKISMFPTESEPVIDGRLAAGEWDRCTRIGNLKPRLYSAMEHYVERTDVYVTSDHTAIYFAFRCEQKSEPTRKTKGNEHDLDVHSKDDSVAVVLKPVLGSWDYFLFAGNFEGARSDERRWNKKWDGDWDFAVSCENGYWVAEFRIPWKTIEMQAPGKQKTIGMNVGRTILRPQGHEKGVILVWNPTHILPHNQGHLNIGNDLPITQFLIVPEKNALSCQLDVLNPSSLEWNLQGDLQIFRKDSRQLVHQSDFPLKIAAVREATFEQKIPDLQTGSYIINLVVNAINVQGGKATVLEQSSVAQIAAPFRVELRKYFFHDQVQPVVYLKDTADALGAVVSFRLQKDGKVLQTMEVSASDLSSKPQDPRWEPSMGKPIFTYLDISKIAPGYYDIEVVVKKQGQADRSGWLCFEKPEKAEWIDSPLGIDDKVPAPWTPVKVKNRTVKVWGRDYEFSDSAMPKQIVNQGISMLASPISVNAVIDGRRTSWFAEEFDVIESNDARAVLKLAGKDSGAMLGCVVEIGYDGLMKFDLDVHGASNSHLEKLSIDIPLNKAVATLLLGAPDDMVRGANKPWPSWSGANSGLIPDKKISGPFIPNLWIGNDDMGLVWYCESDENWAVQSPAKAIEMIPENDRVLWRFNVVDVPISLKETWKFTFGLQATPVKKMQPRKNIGVTYHWSQQIFPVTLAKKHVGQLVYSAEGNINPEKGTLTLWVDRDNIPAKKLVEKYGQGKNNPFKIMGCDNSSAIIEPFDMVRLVCSSGEEIAVRFDPSADEFSVWKIKDGVSTKVLYGICPQWKSQALHEISFSWGEKWGFFVDGEKIGSAEHSVITDSALVGSRLFISGLFALRGIRIQDTSSSGGQLASDSVDSHTLLLDNFSNWASERKIPVSIAKKISEQSVLSGGKLIGMWDVVPGAGGNVVRLIGRGAKMDVCAYRKRVLLLDYIYFHESWTEFMGMPYTKKHQKYLKDFTKRAHDVGLKVIMYTGSVVGEFAEEVFHYLDECTVEPLKVGYWRTASEPQLCYYHSPTGQWQNMLLYKIDQLVREFDIDGLYFDGSLTPIPDKNRWHGAGYVDNEKTVQATTQIFAYRQWAQRLRKMVDRIKPDFQLDVHAAIVLPACMSYADSVWTGEHYAMVADAHHGGVLQKCFTLGAFRANCMGKQFSLHADYLSWDRGKPWRLDTGKTFSYLHGIPVRGDQDDTELIRAMMETGLDINSADWRPYYLNEGEVEISSPDVKLSYFKGQNGRWFMVLANTGESSGVFDVQFHESIPGMPTGRSMWFVEGGEFFGKFDGKFKVALDPWKPVFILTE